jgi:hypothetical protein
VFVKAPQYCYWDVCTKKVGSVLYWKASGLILGHDTEYDV